jgi:hypothetical protein
MYSFSSNIISPRVINGVNLCFFVFLPLLSLFFYSFFSRIHWSIWYRLLWAAYKSLRLYFGPCKGPLYVLIRRETRIVLGKNPNPAFSFSAASSFSSWTHLGFLPPNSCLHGWCRRVSLEPWRPSGEAGPRPPSRKQEQGFDWCFGGLVIRCGEAAPWPSDW